MTRISNRSVKEIAHEYSELIQSLALALDERRRANLSENRSVVLDQILRGSEEYQNGSDEFRRVISAEVQGVCANIIARRLVRQHISYHESNEDWLSGWERRRDNRNEDAA